MTKTALMAAATGLAALSLAACLPHPHHKPRPSASRVVSQLDCPERQGDLRRTSAAADGRSCLYSDQHGSEVSLQIVNLNGGESRDVLKGFEDQLKAELPASTVTPPKPVAAADGGDNDVDIDLPGIRIRADKDGGAQIRAGGVHIDADEDNAHVRVHKRVTVDKDGKTVITTEDDEDDQGVSVDANDDGAMIHVAKDGRRGVQRTLILVSKTPGPHGFKLAGYEARGPRTGPLVVATVKGRSEDHDDLYGDLRDLIGRNVRS